VSLYEPIEQWVMPPNVLADSLTEMVPDGQAGCEGIVLWLGTVESGAAAVKHLVGLAGPGVVKHPDHLRVSPDLLNEVSQFAEARSLMLVGQIHSHPGTDVRLSPTDLRYGISAPYFLSVVAPHYAQDPSTRWSDCGVNIYVPKKGFLRMAKDEVSRRVVIDGGAAPLSHVGS
jgi:proteasome lid subunit RPN8/RPN11